MIHNSLTMQKLTISFSETIVNTQFYTRGYGFGFNGQEMDNEITGQTGSHTTAMFWEYDTRIGRRWNIDPVDKPWMSSYHAFSNKPIWNIDPNGALDTKYEDEDGNLIMETDDGSDDVVTVPEEYESDMDEFAFQHKYNSYYNARYNTSSWNNAMRGKFGASTDVSNPNDGLLFETMNTLKSANGNWSSPLFTFWNDLTDESGALETAIQDPTIENFLICAGKRIVNQTTQPMNWAPGPDVFTVSPAKVNMPLAMKTYKYAPGTFKNKGQGAYMKQVAKDARIDNAKAAVFAGEIVNSNVGALIGILGNMSSGTGSGTP